MKQLTAIALAWAAYGLLHSWLASNSVKGRVATRWPQHMHAYRLAYNALALLLLLPPLWLTLSWDGAALWHWPAWIAWPITLAASAGVLWTLRWYDGMDFLGLRQWRSGRASEAMGEALCFSPLHRHVRHPWYALGLLLLWSRDMNAAWLAAAITLTLYVLVGIRLEEKKLVAAYGEAYRRYRQRVPALVPWPGRSLTATQAGELVAMATPRQDDAAPRR